MIGHFIHGQGPTRALVLHGWLSDCRVFEAMLPALDPERFTLAFMDYRGYGASKALSGPFDIATIAQDAIALADHLGWPAFSVVGHSMGGKAALRLAANHPGRVLSILGIAPVWAGRVPFNSEEIAFFRGAARDVAARQTIASRTTGNRLPAAWARDLARRSAESSHVEAFAAYFESWSQDDFSAAVASLSVPTVAVIGARDPAITSELVARTWLAALPRATLTVLPESGHYPMLECPPMMAAVFESSLPPSIGP